MIIAHGSLKLKADTVSQGDGGAIIRSTCFSDSLALDQKTSRSP